MADETIKETVENAEGQRHQISITHKIWKILMMEKIEYDLEDFDTIIDSAILDRKRKKESFDTIVNDSMPDNR